MELIEIGRNSFCLGMREEAVPKSAEKLRAFAGKMLSENGFSLPDGAEITAFSNGFYTLLFVCGTPFSARPSLRSFLS